jgi:hypothetical protein
MPELAGGTALAGKQNPGQPVLDENRHHPLDEARVTTMIASLRPVRNLAAQPGDFKIDAGPVMAGLDRHTARGAVPEALGLEKRPQRGHQIVHDHLQTAEPLERLDGSLGCFQQIRIRLPVHDGSGKNHFLSQSRKENGAPPVQKSPHG